jgi:antitoxin component YwqK of YwqJK toxin-antitoxin module
MKCNYIDNKMNGFFKKYYDNGELEIEYNYNDDILKGLYIQYDLDGKNIRRIYRLKTFIYKYYN